MKVPHTLFLQLPQTFVTAYNNKNKGGSFVAADLILQTPANLPVASAALTVKVVTAKEGQCTHRSQLWLNEDTLQQSRLCLTCRGLQLTAFRAEKLCEQECGPGLCFSILSSLFSWIVMPSDVFFFR